MTTDERGLPSIDSFDMFKASVAKKQADKNFELYIAVYIGFGTCVGTQQSFKADS